MEKKKLGPIKYIITLGVIIFVAWLAVQIIEYRRFTPPINYDYKISKDIDVHYHDQFLVERYFENVYRLSSFANEQWYNYEIDVRFPDLENPKSVLANQAYQKMMSNTKYIESLLIASKELKTEGATNEEIKIIEATGKTIDVLQKERLYSRVEIAEGDKGLDVIAIQEKLNKLGYDIPKTGLFSIITKNAVSDFQNKNDLFPTGIVDQQTLQHLLKKTK